MSNKKIIGFVGIEQYDIILYLSRVLKNLDKRVLIIDSSEIKKLSSCVPYSDLLLAKPDPKQAFNIIDFSGVDVVVNKHNNKTSSFLKLDYDYILIDFGFDFKNREIELCNEIFMIINLDKSIANKLNLSFYALSVVEKKHLVFRDVLDCKIKPSYVLDEHLPNLDMDKKHYSILYYDSLDQKIKVNLQYDESVSFRKLSTPYKNWLKDTVALVSSIPKKDIEKAYKQAERGK